ncbi:MAG: hypothetical protein IJ111_01460 [Eggerthellaceae bacterium]|nr:hypothetical protein [Eggerthellaceae bacterium]
MIGKPQEIITWLFSQDREKLYEVKERKKGRSLTQNAYYWVLLNQLARKLGYSDTDVHGYMLREYGVCEVFSVRSDVPIEGYFRYYDVIGTGYVNGKEFKHVKVYKGSSEMDSAEFSHLLDGMRQECEAQGLPVMTPEEIARMKFVEAAA